MVGERTARDGPDAMFDPLKAKMVYFKRFSVRNTVNVTWRVEQPSVSQVFLPPLLRSGNNSSTNLEVCLSSLSEQKV